MKSSAGSSNVALVNFMAASTFGLFLINNSRNIKSLFPYKDWLARSLMSKVIYKASCWDCNEFYIGETKCYMTGNPNISKHFHVTLGCLSGNDGNWRQRKCHLKINIYEMVTILRLLLLLRILYCFRLSFGKLRQRILLKCVPHVQYDHSVSSFNQSDHCFLASPLPLPSSLRN